jgi:hypothetical protein
VGIKLWVDDLRNPDQFVGPGWHWAKTATEAIRILDDQTVDEVSLDHDITHAILPGDEPKPSLIYQPVCCPETFESVARFIAASLPVNSMVVRIHTANMDGQKKMVARLVDAGWKITSAGMAQPLKEEE